MNHTDITVVIPTKNEEKNILRFLSRLPDFIKLTVVDSSDDRTRELINIKRQQNTEIIFKECTIPEARQLGAEQVATPWILYSDADMVFDEKYFRNLETLKIDNKVGAVMGAKRSKKSYRWYYFLYSYSIWIFSKMGIPIGSGSNMIIRKKALENVGGFDFALTHSEDNDILIRIKKAGWRVIYSNKLIVYEEDHRKR